MSSAMLEFLHKAAAAIPSANRTHMLLKSFLLYWSIKSPRIAIAFWILVVSLSYRTRSSATTNTQYVTAQHNTPDEGSACRKCCTPWQEASFEVRVRPRRNNSRRARQLVQQHESHANGLSASQLILAKKYLKSTSTSVVGLNFSCISYRRL